MSQTYTCSKCGASVPIEDISDGWAFRRGDVVYCVECYAHHGETGPEAGGAPEEGDAAPPDVGEARRKAPAQATPIDKLPTAVVLKLPARPSASPAPALDAGRAPEEPETEEAPAVPPEPPKLPAVGAAGKPHGVYRLSLMETQPRRAPGALRPPRPSSAAAPPARKADVPPADEDAPAIDEEAPPPGGKASAADEPDTPLTSPAVRPSARRRAPEGDARTGSARRLRKDVDDASEETDGRRKNRTGPAASGSERGARRASAVIRNGDEASKRPFWKTTAGLVIIAALCVLLLSGIACWIIIGGSNSGQKKPPAATSTGKLSPEQLRDRAREAEKQGDRKAAIDYYQRASDGFADAGRDRDAQECIISYKKLKEDITLPELMKK